MQSTALAALIAHPRLSDMPRVGMRIIMCLRLVIIARRRAIDPIPLLAERIGGITRAHHALHIVHLVGDMWPERFTLSPPCCGAMSHDEALLAELAGHADAADRPAFDRAGADLLASDARDQLWREFTRWALRT